MTPSSIIPAARHAERRHQGAGGSQAPVPWQLPRNVSDSDDPAAAESAPNAEYAPLVKDGCGGVERRRTSSYVVLPSCGEGDQDAVLDRAAKPIRVRCSIAWPG